MYLGVQGLMPADLSTVDLTVTGKIRDFGFTGAACRWADPLSADEASVSGLRDTLRAGDVDPCQAVARHPDLVTLDPTERAEGVRAMRHMCRVTRWLGAGNLYVRPGGMNPKGSWYSHPDNRSAATFDRLVDSLKQLCSAAEAEGIALAIEGHVLSPLYNAQRVKDVIDAVGSDALRFNMDPVNFVGGIEDAYDTTALLNELFDTLGPYTVCGHAKDFRIEDRLVLHLEETVIGEGLLDQATFLRRFEECCPDGYVQIEHLPEEKIPAARESLYKTGHEVGIRWRGLDQ
jgi:sugar phosphate isomerase/epimerase